MGKEEADVMQREESFGGRRFPASDSSRAAEPTHGSVSSGRAAVGTGRRGELQGGLCAPVNSACDRTANPGCRILGFFFPVRGSGRGEAGEPAAGGKVAAPSRWATGVCPSCEPTAWCPPASPGARGRDSGVRWRAGPIPETESPRTPFFFPPPRLHPAWHPLKRGGRAHPLTAPPSPHLTPGQRHPLPSQPGTGCSPGSAPTNLGSGAGSPPPPGPERAPPAPCGGRGSPSAPR